MGRFLVLLSLGLAGAYGAYRLEQDLAQRRQGKTKPSKNAAVESEDDLVDATLEDSFPASDPPSFSPSGYHH